LTSALNGGEWSVSHPSDFTPRERAPGTHWIGDWGVRGQSRSGRGGEKEILSPCRDSNPDRRDIFGIVNTLPCFEYTVTFDSTVSYIVLKIMIFNGDLLTSSFVPSTLASLIQFLGL
jgi:hypothetical protein